MKMINNIIPSLCLLLLSSYVSFSVPILETGIPFTMQSLAVFVIAGFLNPREFVITILIYLAIGSVGLPVFSDGSSGIDKIFGSSGGFLYGFIFSGFFISYNINKKEIIKFTDLVLIFFIATFILFFFGILHLSFKFGFSKALEYGLFPFWKMGLVKAIIASAITYLILRMASEAESATKPL
ncbi:MAG: biotin transporter BioY [Saprospiraceae bacterium]|nr:biotin transporter BioY [Bacteroidia bacterium]NNL90813.1 biotin transporter BioY [Saprospiraceae bacterium]